MSPGTAATGRRAASGADSASAASLLMGSPVLALLLVTHLCSAQAIPPREPAPEPLPRVLVLNDVTVPMRDKILLRADIYLPVGSGRWPTILIRTPYNRHSETSRGYRFFAEHGFAVMT